MSSEDAGWVSCTSVLSWIYTSDVTVGEIAIDRRKKPHLPWLLGQLNYSYDYRLRYTDLALLIMTLLIMTILIMTLIVTDFIYK
jgi:hypothetical protein